MTGTTLKLICIPWLLFSASMLQAGLSDEQLARHWDADTADTARQATLALAIWLEQEPDKLAQWQDRVEANRRVLMAASQRVPVAQSALADGLFGWLIQAKDANLEFEQIAPALPWDDGLVSLLRPELQPGRLARMHALMAFKAPEVWGELRRRLENFEDSRYLDTQQDADPGAVTADPTDEMGDEIAEPEAEPLPGPDEQIDSYWEFLLTPVQPAEVVGINHPEVELAASNRMGLDEAEPALAENEGVDGADRPSEGDASTTRTSTEDSDLQAQLSPAPPSPDAQEQAARVRAWSDAETADQRRRILIEIVQSQLVTDWSANRRLTAIWGLLHALAETATLDEPQSLAADLAALIQTYSSDSARDLRQIDADLPVVMALLEDAAISLETTPADPAGALGLLADAYARLALFTSDAAFYLDQPVRGDLRSALAACVVDPTLVGPVPRAIFEDCLELLVSQMADSLGRVELVGDGDGPFASQFLRREMGLVSWQRVAYLDGHLNWLLGASCTPPQWQNPLEWSLLAHYLSRWVEQRPVFFDSPRWRDAVDAFERQSSDQRNASTLFIDCLSGLGGERLDPVLRLINRHEQALGRLDASLTSATQSHYEEVTRPLADIDLESDSGQLTSYRPESLTIGPCAQTNVCGVRAELPVSRALLGEFPNAFLLADQLKLGQLDLCYQDVRWIDRETRPGRSNDPRVANYFGHLSFDLVGTFERAGQAEVVFRHRMRSAESRHYLFASSAPEVLELDCPNELAGQPISSQLPDDHLGLVPDRLTYFVSQPTSAEAELLANWDQGAEWRDWFVTGDRVDKMEIRDGATLATEVEAKLDRLVVEREQLLAGRLLNRFNANQITVDEVTSAMSTVAENTALLRRILEIHYPRLIREDQTIRALLTGESGLLDRDRIRQLPDQDIMLGRATDLGRARLAELREYWLSLPVELRENGQVSPELDFAAERLADLRRLSRSGLGSVE